MSQFEKAPKVLIISNPESGKGRANRILHEFIEFLGMRNADFVVYETQQQRDFEGIRHMVETAKPDILSIIGGDGTIQNVINAIPDFSLPIHCLPGGTGNDLVNTFGCGKNYRKGFETIFSDKTRDLDMGICNGELFINGLGIGFDGEIVKRTQKKSMFLLPLAWKYQLAVWRGVVGYREFKGDVEVDDPKYPDKHLMIAVANGIAYGGGFKVAPEAIPDDGMLDVISISNVPPYKRITNLPKVKKGKHMDLPYITSHQTTGLTIKTNKQTAAHLDGEYFEAQEFVIDLAPSKFRLLV